MKNIKALLPFLIAMSIGCSSVEPLPAPTTKTMTYQMDLLTVKKMQSQLSRNCPQKIDKIDGKNWRPILEASNACVVEKNWSKVETLGQILADNHPTSPWGFYYLALAAEAKSDNLRALWMLEKAGSIDKNLAAVHYQKGRVLAKNNETGAAMAAFQKALELENELPEASSFVAKVFLKDRDFPRAEKYFRMVLKAEPFNRDALAGVAHCRREAGDFKIAMDYWERVISKNSKDFEARYNKAQILEVHLKKIDEALLEYQFLSGLVRENKGSVEFDLNHKIKNLEKLVKSQKQELAARSKK